MTSVEPAIVYPRTFAGYVLLERIGQGGMSEVDLARRRVDDANFVRFLVIKRIKADKTEDSSFLRMFKDEARISSELHHTNIAQVYDFGRDGNDYYLVLEYVPGLDVRAIVNTLRDRSERMPLVIALRIAIDVLDGLHYAHTRVDTFGKPMQIVHRDVNPRNILVSTRGEVKLIDFGVAKAVGRLEQTRTDHVKGKFAYMAPEQVACKAVDHRADVFAAALTLHEMLTGFNPFHGLNQVQIMHRLIAGQIPDLPAHPELPDPTALQRVQKKALAPDPAKRYPDADAYKRDLLLVAQRHGGAANADELARFLRSVEPDLDVRIQRKMQAFAGALEFAKETDADTLRIPAEETDPSRSLSLPPTPVSAPPDRESGSFSMTRTAKFVVGGGLAALAAVGVGTLFAVVAVAVWVAVATPSAEPAAAVAAPGSPPPAVAPVATPVAAPEPPAEATVDPEPPPPATTKPAAKKKPAVEEPPPRGDRPLDPDLKPFPG